MIRKTILGLAAVAALSATAMTTASNNANAGVRFVIGVPYYGGYYSPCGYYGCAPVYYGGYYGYHHRHHWKYWKHHKHWKHHKKWH